MQVRGKAPDVDAGMPHAYAEFVEIVPAGGRRQRKHARIIPLAQIKIQTCLQTAFPRFRHSSRQLGGFILEMGGFGLLLSSPKPTLMDWLGLIWRLKRNDIVLKVPFR